MILWRLVARRTTVSQSPHQQSGAPPQGDRVSKQKQRAARCKRSSPWCGLIGLCALVMLVTMPRLGWAQPEPSSAGVSPSAVVVMYHRFGDSRYPSTNIKPEQVADHLARLQRGGGTVISVPALLDALEHKTALPDRAVVITVDDAYSSVYTTGWPLFKKAGVPWTLFLNTETIGQSGYLTWAQVKELVAAGVTIGAHSHRHAHFPALTPEQQRADMLAMREVFQRELGVQPTVFAYPYGEVDAAAQALLKELGYRAAFGQQSGVASLYADRFYLPRFALNEHYGTPEFLGPRLFALPLPVAEVTPAVPFIAGSMAANPPKVGFTVVDPSLSLASLRCYGPSGEALAVTQTPDAAGTRVAVTLVKPLGKGRSRVNCTLPQSVGKDLRWRWWGTQLLVPGAWD